VCLGIFLLGNMKDTVGVVVPEMLKKPLSVLEVLEDKLSAAVVALAVIPPTIMAHLPEEGETALREGAEGPLLAAIPGVAFPLMLLPLAFLMFGSVWMVFHAVKCLLLLSPSSFVTAGVKFCQGIFLVLFAGTAYFTPWLGIIVSVVLAVGCLLIFGWAFRWNVYGSLFVWDFLTQTSRVPLDEGEKEFSGFLLGGQEVGVKPRSFGRLSQDGENLQFTYKPYLLFPARTVTIPREGYRVGLRKGLIFPAITMRAEQEEEYQSFLELRVRYWSHEEAVAKGLAVDERQPSRLVQGARNAWSWFRQQLEIDLGPVREG
ncbi:MAG: hypothetical protein AAF191_08040, partial [Verrucomicrobiota bacterium]